jgi:predicted secreted protein
MSDFKKGTDKLLFLYIGDVYVPIGCLTTNSFSEESEMLDTTTRQNAGGWRTSIPTLQSFNISFDGIVSRTNKNGSIVSYDDLQTLKRTKVKVNWKTNSEKVGYSDFGMGYINVLSNNAEIDSFISFSAEIIGYGEPVTQLDTQSTLNYLLNVTI